MTYQEDRIVADLADLKTLVQRHIENDHKHLQRAIEGEPVRDLSGNVIRHEGGLQGDIKELNSNQAIMVGEITATKDALTATKDTLADLVEQNGSRRIKLTKGQFATATSVVVGIAIGLAENWSWIG